MFLGNSTPMGRRRLDEEEAFVSAIPSGPEPELRLTIMRERGRGLGWFSAILWGVGVGLTVADAANHDVVPDALPRMAAILAAAATVAAVVFSTGYMILEGVLSGLAELTRAVFVRERAHREALRRLAIDPGRNGTAPVDRSEYWQVYADVMHDLAGVDGEGDPGPG